MKNGERIIFTLKAYPIVTIATLVICLLTQWTASLLGYELPEQLNVKMVRELFIHAFESPRYFAYALLNASLILAVLPILEELVFRYLAFALPVRLVGRRFKSQIPVAIFFVVSAALFASAHYLKQPFPDNAFVALFFFGIAQCFIYRKTGRIWCAMLNHTLFNLTNLVLMMGMST